MGIPNLLDLNDHLYYLALSFTVYVSVKTVPLGSYHCGAVETNQTSIHEDAGSIPALAQ